MTNVIIDDVVLSHLALEIAKVRFLQMSDTLGTV